MTISAITATAGTRPDLAATLATFERELADPVRFSAAVHPMWHGPGEPVDPPATAAQTPTVFG